MKSQKNMSPVNRFQPAPEPHATEKDFGRDLKAFEQLPAKTKELQLLQDQAEKATGQESVAINKLIRDKSQ